MGIWLVPGLLQCVQEITYARARAGGEGMAVGKILLHFLPTWLPWAAFTPLVLRLVRRLPRGTTSWAHLLAAHSFGAVVFGCAHLLLVGLVRTRFPPGPWADVGLGAWFANSLWSLQAQTEVLAYVGVVIAGYGLEAVSAARAQELHALRLEAELSRSRLGALQSQLQPHFLFNTLNAIDVLIDEEPARAKRILLRLAELLRSTLDDRRIERPLGAELAHLETYLEIERMRLGDRLSIELDVGRELHGACVPSLVLQPLVENALVHGIAPRAAGGRLWISARGEGQALLLAVDDDGQGLAGMAGEGIGLSNTRRRLEQLYGGLQELRIEPRPGGGVSARVRVPLRWGEG